MRPELLEEKETGVDDFGASAESWLPVDELVDDVEVDQAVEDPRRPDLPRRQRRGRPA